MRTLLFSELPLRSVSPVSGSVDIDIDSLPGFRPITELTFTPDSLEAPFGIRRGPFLRTRAMTQSIRIATDILMHNSEIYIANYYSLREGFHSY